MATLEAATYTLRHGIAAASTKRFVFVKLTDSALKAIEDFHLQKDRNQASINISEKEGSIHLPSGDVFNFTVADIPTDVPKGSFECIQKVKKGEVEHLGDIKQRITIHATEDSFSTTRQKMAQADEESKKQCAKQIESAKAGPNISSRVKVNSGKRPLEPPFAHGAANLKKPRVDTSPLNAPAVDSKKKPPLPPVSASQPVINKPLEHHPPTRPLIANPVPRSASSGALNPAPSSSQLGTPNSSRSPLPPARSPLSQSTALRPLRERVIHTLALKTMGKTEFISKLSKFGLKEEERGSQVETILGEVAVFKDGRFDLLPTVLGSQVDPKWPLYTQLDFQNVQRRLSMLENNRPSSSASSVIDKNGAKNLSSAGTNLSVKDGAQKGKGDIDRAFHPGWIGDEAISPPPSGSSTCSTPSPPDHTKLKDIGNRSNEMTKKPNVITGSDDMFGSQDDPMTGLNAEKAAFQELLEARYGLIKTGEQRRSYKKDFYSVYNEYKDLHESMARISAKFADLETRLRQSRKGTSEYRTICKAIQEDYQKLKSDDDYKEKRKRWEYLTAKLTVIKRQIKTFDSAPAKA